MLKKAKIGLEPILKDLQSNTLTKLCYLAYYVFKIMFISHDTL